MGKKWLNLKVPGCWSWGIVQWPSTEGHDVHKWKVPFLFGRDCFTKWALDALPRNQHAKRRAFRNDGLWSSLRKCSSRFYWWATECPSTISEQERLQCDRKAGHRLGKVGPASVVQAWSKYPRSVKFGLELTISTSVLPQKAKKL